MDPFRTIVCALDLSDDVPRALTWAADLSERTHAALHLVHADPLYRARLAHAGDEEDHGDAFRDRVRAVVGEALGAETAFDVLGPELHVTRGTMPADSILQTAAAVGGDLIVTGTHGRRGLAHALAGSVAAEVLRRAPLPVLVVPDHATHAPPGPGRPVLVAVDFSAHTRPALAAAGQLAAAYGAEVELVHVLDQPSGGRVDLSGLLSVADLQSSPSASAREAAQRGLARLAAEAGGLGGQHVPVGEPRAGVLATVEATGAGALVMGTHGRTGWDRLRLGSVAEWGIRHVECAVLTVPSPDAVAEAGSEGA